MLSPLPGLTVGVATNGVARSHSVSMFCIRYGMDLGPLCTPAVLLFGSPCRPKGLRPKKFSTSGHGAVLSAAGKRPGFGGQEAWAKVQRRVADPDGILF